LVGRVGIEPTTL